MKVLAPAPSLFFATALIVSCLLSASCSTPTVRHSEADSDVVRIPESWIYPSTAISPMELRLCAAT